VPLFLSGHHQVAGFHVRTHFPTRLRIRVPGMKHTVMCSTSDVLFTSAEWSQLPRLCSGPMHQSYLHRESH